MSWFSPHGELFGLVRRRRADYRPLRRISVRPVRTPVLGPGGGLASVDQLGWFTTPSLAGATWHSRRRRYSYVPPTPPEGWTPDAKKFIAGVLARGGRWENGAWKVPSRYEGHNELINGPWQLLMRNKGVWPQKWDMLLFTPAPKPQPPVPQKGSALLRGIDDYDWFTAKPLTPLSGFSGLAGTKKKKKATGIMAFFKKVGDVISAPFRMVRKAVIGDKSHEKKVAAKAAAAAQTQAAQQTTTQAQTIEAITKAIPVTNYYPSYYTGGGSGGGGGGGGMTTEAPSALDRVVPGLPENVGGIKTEYLVYGGLGLLGVGLIAALMMRSSGKKKEEPDREPKLAG